VNGQSHALVGLLRCGGEKDYYCLESNTRPTNSSVTVVTVRSLILMGVIFVVVQNMGSLFYLTTALCRVLSPVLSY